MGYESRFYIVDKSSLSADAGGYTYAQVVAMFDMCKMGYESATLRLVGESPDTDCYFYGEDGNKEIKKDKYGDKIKDVPLYKLKQALKTDDTGYRRIKPFLACLRTLKKKDWKDLRVLHYGY